ncbi:hypothetical protein HYH02_002721 [Chlamydomonas schloesseri]|uniref:MYND-type domain-containing protein n=1 Tax=Chlamydomonas schloesseri TaxID=2026947 RepID=A0A836BAA1_9CHLO|nr:hypothetical protein HYH02_002721 [Chlamydomonas schloesseri]|eukprot:KAG2452482.1 hypothetical protein HYH02_002721 [Chlamydomonas schloesseri]
METFFPDDSPLRFWLCNASVAQIACTVTWPPVIAVTGYAPCVRAWAPTSRDEPEFRPVQQLMEVDGERFVAVAVKGDLLVAADASPSGRISVWDTHTWERQQTITAGAPVTALDASRTYIAAGTSAGYVRVWRRQSAVDATFTQYFVPDVQLDSLPIYTVRLGPLRQPGGGGGGGGSGVEGGAAGAAGSDTVMVVHTRGNGRVSAWRLSDAKIIGTLGRPAPAPGSAAEAEALLSANVVCSVLGRDGTLLTASWMPGRPPLLQWVNPLARSGSEVPGVSQHLAGLTRRPLCCDADGNAIALGFEDGTVWVWGVLHSYQPQSPPSASAPETSTWRGYHRGAVGAVACLPHRPGGQLASAGADGAVKLWAMGGGQLLAVARLGWQVTSLAVNEVALVAGGTEGQVQVLVLVSEEQAAAGHSSRPTQQELAEAAMPPPASASSSPAVAQYEYWFDARSPKQAAAAAGGAGSGGGGAGVCGRAEEYTDAFAAFVPPRKQLTAADLQQQQQHHSNSSNGNTDSDRGAADDGGGGAGGGGGGGASGSVEAEMAAAEGLGAGGDSKAASSFNMRAAIKGAQRSAADEAAAAEAEEAAKRAQLRAMGEAPGVARSRGAVQLDSATAALGRKCCNPSCLQREGVAELRAAGRGGGAGGGAGGAGAGAAFKRCGACKSVVYCSAHCQSTHWRDGHKKECAALAAAWKQQQEAEAAAVAAALAAGEDGEDGAAPGSATSAAPDSAPPSAPAAAPASASQQVAPAPAGASPAAAAATQPVQQSSTVATTVAAAASPAAAAAPPAEPVADSFLTELD